MAAALPIVMAVAPTVLNMIGQRRQAAAGEAAAEADAVQLQRQAQVDRAMAQRDALEERRQGRLALSRLLARAPSSDPTIANLAGDITSDAEYRAMSAIYSGETGARSREAAATQRRRAASDMSGENQFQQLGSLISMGSKMYQNFGGGGFNAYSYNNDAGGTKYSATGADVMARR